MSANPHPLAITLQARFHKCSEGPETAVSALTAVNDRASWGSGPYGELPAVVRVLHNDIAGEHRLGTATLRVTEQPTVGEATVVLPPESLAYPLKTPLEEELEAAQRAAAEAEAAREGRTYQPPPVRTLQQQWDDELNSYERHGRDVADLYRHHTIIVYTADNYDGHKATSDRFTYEVCDTRPQPACSQATVTVRVNSSVS